MMDMLRPFTHLIVNRGGPVIGLLVNLSRIANIKNVCFAHLAMNILDPKLGIIGDGSFKRCI